MATKRLTQNFVQTVKPPKTGQLEYFDNHLQGGGVGLRVGYGGKKPGLFCIAFMAVSDA